MKEAYLLTIGDFEIALANTGIFEFRRQKFLIDQINYYELKLSQLNDSIQ